MSEQALYLADRVETLVVWPWRGKKILLMGIEVSNPGGLVNKTAYDGAIQYSTDGGSGTAWSAAGSR